MRAEPELFDREPEEAESDDKLPPDRYRNCGRCGQQFWSQVRRNRPTYVPYHCDHCGIVIGEDLKRRTEIWRSKMRSGELRWKRRPLTGDKPWERTPPGEPWIPTGPGFERPPEPKRKQAKRPRKRPPATPEPAGGTPEAREPAPEELRMAVQGLFDQGKK